MYAISAGRLPGGLRRSIAAESKTNAYHASPVRQRMSNVDPIIFWTGFECSQPSLSHNGESAMSLKQYTCDVQVMGKGLAKGVVVWLKAPDQSEAKKAAQVQFPGQTLGSVVNIKEKK